MSKVLCHKYQKNDQDIIFSLKKHTDLLVREHNQLDLIKHRVIEMFYWCSAPQPGQLALQGIFANCWRPFWLSKPGSVMLSWIAEARDAFINL